MLYSILKAEKSQDTWYRQNKGNQVTYGLPFLAFSAMAELLCTHEFVHMCILYSMPRTGETETGIAFMR